MYRSGHIGWPAVQQASRHVCRQIVLLVSHAAHIVKHSGFDLAAGRPLQSKQGCGCSFRFQRLRCSCRGSLFINTQEVMFYRSEGGLYFMFAQQQGIVHAGAGGHKTVRSGANNTLMYKYSIYLPDYWLFCGVNASSARYSSSSSTSCRSAAYCPAHKAHHHAKIFPEHDLKNP